MRTRPSRTAAPLVPLAAALALALVAGAGAGPATAGPPGHAGGPGRPQPAPVAPTFVDATVHDPSVVVADDEIWVFGSHLQVARTDDLMAWEQVAAGVTPDNPIFEDVTTELAEALEWAQTDTLWAPDVFQLPDGRFAMYYNACKGDSPRSAMGLAVADSVAGPYEDQGVFLRSGMWDQPSEDGAIYDARVHPNVVDPDVFVDADGRMWMVYGSYSGGIFILEMDPVTGFPLPGQGYGEHLVGGNHSRIEAPSILFDEGTGYYYLFLSFGGLDANGGYNVRVARSEHPDGPYVDAEGNPMSEVRSDPSLPLFDDASIAPYGVKLLGNHLFQREVGDPGTGLGTGYVSPGHNSTWTDPETGEHALVFHSRFPGQGETHHVRVHEMTMNAHGWPVVAPYRYAGDAPGAHPGKRPDHRRDTFRLPDVAAQYALVDHGKAISPDITRAVTVRLERNGRVTGDREGRWQLRGDDGVRLTVDGATYDGVLARQWQPDRQEWVVTFSVQSRAGVSLWGSAVPPLSATEAVAAVAADLDLGDTSAVVTDLTLPTTGTHGTTIAWASSDPAVVSADGEVTRPEHGAGDASVTLTATVRNERRAATVRFEVTVPERTPGGLAGTWSFEGDLAEATGTLPAGTVTGPRIGTTGGTVSYVPGVAGQALHLDGTSGVQLPQGLVSGPTYSVSLWLRPDAVTPYTAAFFAARDERSWVSVVPRGPDGSTMVWSGESWYDASTGGQVPVGEWTHLALTVDGGDVAVYVDGAQRFAGTGFPQVLTTTTGTFAVGVNWWDTPFQGAVDELTVHTGALSADEVAALATR